MNLRQFGAAILAVAAWSQASAEGGCASENADPVEVVRSLYAAVSRGDSAAVSRLFAPGFYAFDHGRRMTGADLTNQVDDIRKRQLPYVWVVEDAEGHVACDIAWVTYINRHVPLPGANVQPTAYLESVVLSWVAGDWKLRFFHSTPAPAQ